MGQLVAGGQIDETTVVDELTAAAARCGLAGTEVARTRSGRASTSGAREPQYPDPDRAQLDARDQCQLANLAHSTGRRPRPSLRHTADAADTPRRRARRPRRHDATTNRPTTTPKARSTKPTSATPAGSSAGTATSSATPHTCAAGSAGTAAAGRATTDGYVDRCAHATAQSIVAEIPTLADPDEAEETGRMVDQERSSTAPRGDDPHGANTAWRAVGAQQLDADPWALNVLNGTVDLRTGDLRPHDPADLITKCRARRLRPGRDDARWDAYLAVRSRRRRARRWLQRAVGYTLTGDTSEELLFFVHGPARAGKSTFLEAIKAALGDYSRKPTGRRSSTATTAAAPVPTSPASPAPASSPATRSTKAKLAEGLVKTLTGGDTITARFLYRDEFEYRPAVQTLARREPQAEGPPRRRRDLATHPARPVRAPARRHVDLELKHTCATTRTPVPRSSRGPCAAASPGKHDGLEHRRSRARRHRGLPRRDGSARRVLRRPLRVRQPDERVLGHRR
jgi:hypothetical protein